jgi:hypothetical protein
MSAGGKSIDTEIMGPTDADARLDRIENFLYFGNGDSLRTWMGIMTTKMEALNEATKDLPAMKISVEKHHAEPHLWGWMRSGKFWATIVGGYVALHLLATYVPNIWNGIVIALGWPQLVVPLA